MKYLDLINDFWRLNEEFCFTPSESKLYFALLNISNRLRWKQTFNQSNARLVLECGITEPTLIKARNVLKQRGLIDFKAEKGRRNNTEYTLKYSNKTLNNFSISDSISDSISSEKALDNIRYKDKEEDKTIKSTTNVVPKKATKPLFSLDFIDDENFKKLFEEWLDYKRRVKHNSYKDQKQIELAYRKMYELCGGDIEMCRAIIEQSIANNWQGLFELKTQSFNNQKTTVKNEQNKQSGAALGRVATSDQHRAVTL